MLQRLLTIYAPTVTNLKYLNLPKFFIGVIKTMWTSSVSAEKTFLFGQINPWLLWFKVRRNTLFVIRCKKSLDT